MEIIKRQASRCTVSAAAIAEEAHVPVEPRGCELRKERVECHVGDRISVSLEPFHDKSGPEIVQVRTLVLRSNTEVPQTRRKRAPDRNLPVEMRGDGPNRAGLPQVPELHTSIGGSRCEQIEGLGGLGSELRRLVEADSRDRALVAVGQRSCKPLRADVDHVHVARGAGDENCGTTEAREGSRTTWAGA